MALPEEDTQQLQSPVLVLDGLYCEEQGFKENNAFVDGGSQIYDQNENKEQPFSYLLLEQDLHWEENELQFLLSKENETYIAFHDVVSDGPLMVVRREAIDWILRVTAHYGFSALTTVLAVNFFDRFISSGKFQKDKPWMGHLAAVACLSLAAKVEEIQVPYLLDLQVKESKYVFEAKTIKRMELLMLSTLGWKMNPVTPISYFDHIGRRFGLKTPLHWEFLWRCERLLLSVISDSTFMSCLPSILATATMLNVIEEVETCDQVEYQTQLMTVLKTEEDKVNECHKLILELSGNQKQCHKRKHLSTPGSPDGLIDTSLSIDSYNYLRSLSTIVSSSPVA